MDIQSKINKYSASKKNIQDDYNLKFAYTDNYDFVDIYINDKLFIRGLYDVLGCYNVINSIWIWSWSINQIEKYLYENVKHKAKILHGKLLDGNITENTEKYLYYLGNDNFFISYKNIDNLLKFMLYMTKGEYILAHKVNDNNPKIIEFIVINKIIQQHS